MERRGEDKIVSSVIEVCDERYFKNCGEAKSMSSILDKRDEINQLFFEKAFGLDYLDFEQKITMKKFMKLSQEEQMETRKRFGQICKKKRQELEMM